jgi:glycosyltransferase involved in cell wall biosynthesis
MLLKFPPAFEVIVINNNSTDNTIQVAKNAGATVLSENRKAMAMLV